MSRPAQSSPAQSDPSSSTNRRSFLKLSAGVASALYLGAAPAAPRFEDKLRIAVIGCGGRGGSNLKSVSHEQIVALCDVNENNLGKAAEAHPNVRSYTDFRR
ncbi:MAG: gfo/Idh/MocA family oxidoreductase, partial [Planctomycetaceae bacterium]|nr:gfo/Idh/MocA family oxidoreductase [Planctomycetaceae bacterium]